MIGKRLALLIFITALSPLTLVAQDKPREYLAISLYNWFDVYRELYYKDFIQNIKPTDEFQPAFKQGGNDYFLTWSNAALIAQYSRELKNFARFSRHLNLEAGISFSKTSDVTEYFSELRNDTSISLNSFLQEKKTELILSASYTFHSQAKSKLQFFSGAGFQLLQSLKNQAHIDETWSIYVIGKGQLPSPPLKKHRVKMRPTTAFALFVPIGFNYRISQKMLFSFDMRPGLGYQVCYGGVGLLKAQFPFGAGIKYGIR